MTLANRLYFMAFLAVIAAIPLTTGATLPPGPAANFGPYNATFLDGGIGITRPLAAAAPVLKADAPWSLRAWVRPTVPPMGTIVLGGIGDAGADACRCLILDSGKLAISLGDGKRLGSPATLEAGAWRAVSASYDGKTARLFVDGKEVAAQKLASVPVPPTMLVAPDSLTRIGARHFGGSLALFELRDTPMSASDARDFATARPDFDLIVFHQVGVGWPWQLKAWRGLQEPQDPWTLPKGKAPFSKPVAQPANATPGLKATDVNTWTVGAWRLIEAPKVSGDGANLSQPGFNDANWYVATVPGTVLTTLIDRGVYPDYDYGLNNLAIPESLARQDYWYRSTFDGPAALAGRDLTLTFKGINYAAEVWLNGTKLGSIRGAFIRGRYDVSAILKTGARNVLAVRVSPPPHPGIPHEESIAAGPGENGGNVALDGPTFADTEGWDWIPGIRDRNTGLWQGVELAASGRLQLLDPQVITQLPLPKLDRADISIRLSVDNRGASAASAVVEAKFDTVAVRKSVSIPPGHSEIVLTPAEFPQLAVANPRLWWPNGYGEQNLYHLSLSISGSDGVVSDTRTLRFGVREYTYELSLFAQDGQLRRVEVDPTAGSARGERLVDVRHEAIKQSPRGWVESLTPEGETSPAVRPVDSVELTPYLVIRVNGVRIAARGGSWGMDDSRKRISRERLEPYFKLHKAANLNIIRNWMGTNTEDVFYDLADEYGLMILNDFWASTQDFQVEPQDPALFIANARDTILRYRNHPSIVVWFGRNEGVPQPVLNEGLAELAATLDGTRHYTGSSNNINLQGSGPYNYRPPEKYFTELAQGFSVEVGTPSLATLESIEATVPKEDRWPISDTLAYHDWHFGGNGDVASFMQTLGVQFGEATSLEDFERKAQMMNYVTYRALFEGFLAGLWTKNSGRLLWMTHPSWPSNHWQIYSSDYDTHASYYGVKKASEAVHAQMNLPDFRLAVINSTREARAGLTLESRVLSLDDKLLLERKDAVNATADAVTNLGALDLAPLLAQEGLVLVTLRLTDSAGALVSGNFYWQGRDEASYRKLNDLAQQPVGLSARSVRVSDEMVVTAQLENRGSQAALAAKLTLVDDTGARILPALYSDNYVSLLPGESRSVEIRYPAHLGSAASLNLRGWNVRPGTTLVRALR
ncbi:MAG TPA: LamG-like jellyroll fold domain-containing protein [Steroidobacteraceae bacterium]|nr:LamG-like jellyroll fold domain-containing protein [Steroidobacteraceae bacterium]